MQNSGSIDVSILIVNYNTLTLTRNCIQSIIDYTTDINYEIILVDNASKDGSKDFFSNDKRINYVYFKQNIGFGKANNLGFNIASGKYIFLLNSDTVLLNNAVKIFYDFAEKSNDFVGCIGSLLVDENLKIIHSYGNFPNYYNILDEWVFFPIRSKLGFKNPPRKYDSPSQIRENYFFVDYITGADIFLRKDIAKNYGLFDPDFFMYYEETEMQYRYNKEGYRSVIIDGPSIIHFFGGSDIVNEKLSKKLVYLKSLYIFLSKHRSVFSLYLFWSFFLVMYFPIIILSPVPISEKETVIKALFSKKFYKL